MKIETNEHEIIIDAKIVLCAMRGGMDAIMEWGLRNRHLFPTTDSLTNRVFSLKKKPATYITAISEKAAELELKYKNVIP